MAAAGSPGSIRSESAARSAAGSVSGDVMNGATASPTTGTWSASSTSRIARKSAASPRRHPLRGYDASFSSWKALIDDTTSHFKVEDVHTGDEWALIRWRYVWGPGPDHSVRGVNVMRVVDGKIVEAAGYSKTAPTVAALEG